MSKIQSRLDCPSNQKLLHHYQHAKIIQSICSIHQIICEIHSFICEVQISSIHSWGAADFRISRPKRPHPCLTSTMQKLLKSVLNFLYFYQHKISILHWFLLEIQPILISWDQSCHTHFLTTPTPIFFNQLLISMNLHQHAKNQAFSLFLF